MSGIVDELLTTFIETRRIFMHHLLENFDEKSTTFLQIEALSFVEEHHGTPVKDVAEYLGLSMSSSTQLIERLVQSNWMEREHDEKDRRVVRLYITKDGMSELENAKKTFRAKIEKLVTVIPQKDLLHFLHVHKQLCTILYNQTPDVSRNK